VQEPVYGTDHTSVKESSPGMTDASLLVYVLCRDKMEGKEDNPGKNERIFFLNLFFFVR